MKKRLLTGALALIVLFTANATVVFVGATPGSGNLPPIVPTSIPLPPIVIDIDIEQAN